MKPNAIKTAMIRSAVEKGIRDIKENPKRGIRNLVELGELFAGGRYQQEFFATVMNQLKDEHSAYYQIVEQMVGQMDAQALATFGINMGYNAMSHGASIIRGIEETEAFNVPWCLVVDVGYDKIISPFDVEGLIEDGKELGIYFYLIYIDPGYPDLAELMRVLGAKKECAFCLFCGVKTIDVVFCDSLAHSRNLAVMMDMGEQNEGALEKAARRLLGTGAICGGFSRLYDMAAEEVCSDMLAKPARLGLSISCYARVNKHHPFGTDDVYKAFIHLREHLDMPVIPIDLYEDIAHVDRIVSSQACLAIITGEGNLILVDADRDERKTGCNIHQTSLYEALHKTMPKHHAQPKPAPTASM